MEQKPKSRYAKWVVMGCALLCFAGIAGSIMENPVVAFDEAVRHWVYAQRSPLLDAIFIPVTYMGNWQSVTILAIILLANPKTVKDIGLPFAVISLSSTVIYKVAKSIFERPRPELDVHLISQGGFSFPSGHAMNCMVCFGILIYFIRRFYPNRRTADILTVLLTLLIMGIGISRVYVGVHYPTDVLAGWSLGLAFLMGAILSIEKIRGEKHDISEN